MESRVRSWPTYWLRARESWLQCFLALVRTGVGLLVLGDQREKAGVLTDLPAEITDLFHHIIHQERGPVEVGIDQI